MHPGRDGRIGDPIYWCDRTSPYLAGAETVALPTTRTGLLGKAGAVLDSLE